MRACGECQWCCMVFRIAVLQKPSGTWCRHLDASGCSIYPQRPEVCRKFNCYWLTHEELAADLRPDHIGVILSDSGTIDVAGLALRVIRASKTMPFSMLRPAAQSLLDQLIAEGMVVMVVDGNEMHLEYDRERFATASPEAIEAAYRHQQSEEAEELKRLGAAGEDFRPA